jgi:ABC-type amino acid transport substrate-binding protein
MKSMVAGFLALCLLLTVPVRAQESAPPTAPAAALRLLNDFGAPPFASLEGIKRVGFEVDLAEALGKEMGLTVRWTQMIFNLASFASALRAKTADAAMASITVTPEREKDFLFTRPYFRSSLALATFRDVDFNRTEFKTGLDGRRVGVLKRTTGEEWARKNLKATRVTFDNPERLARALNNKDVAYILLDQDILAGVLARGAYKFKIVETNLSIEDYAIAVGPGNQGLADRLDAALEKLDASGVYDEIYNTWFGRKADLPPYKKLLRR